MWYLNSFLNSFFDLLLISFQSLNPFWSVCIFSFLTGFFMLLIFRYTSNQEGIGQVKDRIKAHLFEFRLYKDDFGILLSAQKNILLYTVKYMKHLVKPVLFMILPVAIILIQLEGWFGYIPLKLGESTVVSVKIAREGAELLSNISIRAEKGLTVETPPLRIPLEREVAWRVRADELGEHKLIFNAAGHTLQKRVIVNDGRLARVSPRVVDSSLWASFLNPGEGPIAEVSFIKRIEVDYRPRPIEIFGWEIHWLLAFFILSIVFGYAFKGFLKVEI
jgi:uncharacterized membrane protein (DUF106 family)